MLEQRWKNYIEMKDIPNDDLKIVAEIIGIKNTVDFILAAPGLLVSIPRKPFREAKERYILDVYDGTKYCLSKLAIECDLSQRQVYKIIKKKVVTMQKH